jgi:ABC-type multidrug transport system fused ATPase/permease subunit
MLSVVVVLLTAIFAMTFNVQPSLAAFAVVSSQRLSGILQWSVRVLSQAESEAVSVERLLSFRDDVPQERTGGSDPGTGWPSRGEVEFRGLEMRYRPGLPLVLDGLSFAVPGGTSVGVVGRTGAGKSSLLTSLFRLVEASGGTVLIDGVDISTVPLQTLRRGIAVIPQDPVMFLGSVRDNLDPFGEHQDRAIWTALEQVSAAAFVRSLPGELSASVAVGGSNISVGQRQLFCVARAILRDCRIVFLDEPSSALDVISDEALQTAIRSALAGRTRFTIAHRINTVLDYDRVMVVDRGQVVEMDAPQRLLQAKGGVFRRLAESSRDDRDAGNTKGSK